MGCYDVPKNPQPRFKVDLALFPLLPLLLLCSNLPLSSLSEPLHSYFVSCNDKPCVLAKNGPFWPCLVAFPNAC